MSRVSLLQLALGGPLLAAIAWLSLARRPWLRAPVAGVIALGAHFAAWGILWITYGGEQVAWRTFTPELLGATIFALVELTLLLAAVRAESLPEGGSAPTIVGLAISASAIGALAYADSIAVIALALPFPTIAAAGAAFSGAGRADARGLIGLAAADAIGLIGLSLAYSRTGSVILGATAGAGPALLLLSALLKSGAVPGLATWRLSSGDGPASWLDVALRGQAIALAALAALSLRSSAPASALAVVAAVAVAAGGGAGLFASGNRIRLAAVTGAAAAVPFLALGLGGAIGTRAFLLLFPATLLASSLVAFLARDDRGPDEKKAAAPAGWLVWLAALIAGAGLASLVGLPPGGGFPGAWLTLSLAAARSEVTLGWLLVVAATGVGLTVALMSSISLIRARAPSLVHAAIGAPVALALLYLGSQPIRVAIGWWIRVETDLRIPEVLPSAGAPGLPAIGGMRLLLLLAPAAVLVAAVGALGRGFRAEGVWAFTVGTKLGGYSPVPPTVERLSRLLKPAAAALRPLAEQAKRARTLGVGLGVAAVLEGVALLAMGRIVVLSARSGFL